MRNELHFTCVKSIKFKTLVCRFWYLHILSEAGKFSIPAGFNGFCSRKNSEKFKGKIVGPIIHCSPDLTRVRIMSNDGKGGMVWNKKWF